MKRTFEGRREEEATESDQPVRQAQDREKKRIEKAIAQKGTALASITVDQKRVVFTDIFLH